MSCWRHSFAFHSLQLQKSSGRKKSPQQQDNNKCAFGRAQFPTKHFFNGHFPFSSVARIWTRYNGISWKFVATSRRWSSNVKMIQLRLVIWVWIQLLGGPSESCDDIVIRGYSTGWHFWRNTWNLTAANPLSIGALLKKLMTIMSENHPGMLHQNNWFCFVQFNCAISPCLDI